MRNIIIIICLGSMNLMAADKVPTDKTDTFSSPKLDGAVLYKKHCSICHGEKAKKSPLSKSIPIAGMNAGALARKTKAYRDKDERHGAFATYKDNQAMIESTYSLSNEQISAIAKYVSSLK